jgi:hypothetical protein
MGEKRRAEQSRVIEERDEKEETRRLSTQR